MEEEEEAGVERAMEDNGQASMLVQGLLRWLRACVITSPAEQSPDTPTRLRFQSQCSAIPVDFPSSPSRVKQDRPTTTMARRAR